MVFRSIGIMREWLSKVEVQLDLVLRHSGVVAEVLIRREMARLHFASMAILLLRTLRFLRFLLFARFVLVHIDRQVALRLLIALLRLRIQQLLQAMAEIAEKQAKVPIIDYCLHDSQKETDHKQHQPYHFNHVTRSPANH